MSAATAKPWTLERRLRLWFVLLSTGLVLAISALSAVHVHRAVRAEVHGLVAEELDEFLVLATGSPEGDEAFDRIALELFEHHPGTPMRFEVWSADGMRSLGVHGSALTPPRSFLPLQLLQTRHVGDALYWRAGELPDGRRVSVLLDASSVLDRYRSFAWSTGLAVLLALGLGLLAAQLFSRRLSAMLERVADSARHLDPGRDVLSVELESPPEEIREVVQALRQLSERARADSERSRLMTAAMAHELRAPIQNLVGEVDVALLRTRGVAEYQQVLARQRELLFELADAVDNLLALCRDGTHESDQRRERFDLGAEVELRWPRTERMAMSYEVSLELERRGRLEIMGDREALCRALRNVVANAIQWSPSGGTVRVALEEGGDEIRVHVSDTGPGIPREDLATIFEPFQRGRPRAGQRAGYGLGLTIVRSAVEAQGGSIELRSPPEGGTEVELRLPRCLPLEPPVSTRAAS